MKYSRQPSKGSDVSKTEKEPKIAKAFKASKTMKRSKGTELREGSMLSKLPAKSEEQKEKSKFITGENYKAIRNSKGPKGRNNFKGRNSKEGKNGFIDLKKEKGSDGFKGIGGIRESLGLQRSQRSQELKRQQKPKEPKEPREPKGPREPREPREPKGPKGPKSLTSTAANEATEGPTDPLAKQSSVVIKEETAPKTEERSLIVQLLDQSSLAQLIKDDLSTYTGSKVLNLSGHEIETLGQLSNLEHVNRLDLSCNKLKSVRVRISFGSDCVESRNLARINLLKSEQQFAFGERYPWNLVIGTISLFKSWK